MIGIGYTPEGLPDSYFTTDLLFEMGYQLNPVNLYEWTDEYIKRRYGRSSPHTTQAWYQVIPRIFNTTAMFLYDGLHK